MQLKENTVSTSSKIDKINLREILIKYTNHWKLILLSTVIAITAAFIYLQLATREYQVSSTILINDEENDGGSNSGISAFEDLGLFKGPKTSLDTEMGILKSKSLIERVVKELNLNVTHYVKNGFGHKEVYGKGRPYNINLFVENSRRDQLDTIFSISANSTTSYDLFDSKGAKVGEGSFGEKIPSNFGDIVATPVDIENIALGEKVQIRISPVEDVSIEYRKRIEVSIDNINSNLLTLKLQDPVKLKAKDILDNLVIYYNKDAVDYNRKMAQNTDEFVSNRIDDISIELRGLDQGVQSYKTRNNLSNLDSEASLVLASNAELANRIVDLTSQIKLIDYVTEYMKSNTDELIPANLGLLNENTSQNTINYNNLVLERNRLSTSANEANPVVANLNDQIASLRESIDQSLSNTRSSLQISLDDARLQEINLSSKISANPRKEREIRDIERQQEIFETLYLYLLQKREENSISLAVNTPIAKIIDKAYGSKSPVAPRRLVVLLAGGLLGLLLPISLIAFRSLLDNKISTAEALEDSIQVPLIGDIPAIESEMEFLAFNNGKSNVAESFRLLRTNVIHLLLNENRKSITQEKNLEPTKEMAQIPGLERVIFDPGFDELESVGKDFQGKGHTSKDAKVIFVTSTIRKEGKTFVAINLASSFALLNKKVLFVEANLRNPKVADYLGTKNEKGLIDFLADRSMGITDVTTLHEGIEVAVIDAGGVPPNPAELLANGRFDELLMESKQDYDYIVIDTPATNAVADTLLLSHHANLFIYVVRANFLSKKMMHIPIKMHRNRRLPNMVMLMNGTDYKNSGYESEYGFGETESKNKWLKKLLG